MVWDSPEYRSRSISLFLAGVAVLVLSIAFAHSFQVAPSETNERLSPSDQVPFLLPTLVGGLLTLMAAMRIAVFARAWILVVVGVALYVAAWLTPSATLLISTMKEFTWSTSELLVLGIFRILGLFLSTSGALRLLFRKLQAGQ